MDSLIKNARIYQKPKASTWAMKFRLWGKDANVRKQSALRNTANATKVVFNVQYFADAKVALTIRILRVVLKTKSKPLLK